MSIKTICKRTLPYLCTGLLGLALTPSLHADEWTKLTKVTFAEDVQVPGKILPAGTYYFKLLDSPSDRHIVQIFDQTNQRLVTTVMAVPNDRVQPRGHTIMAFDERRVGTPEALKTWFYPGDNFGQEFVYSKREVLQTAQLPAASTLASNIAPDVVADTETAEAMPPMEETRQQAEQAKAEEVSAEEMNASPYVEGDQLNIDPNITDEGETVAPAPVQDPVPAPVTAPATDDNPTLPKTGSEMPFMGLLGLASVGSGMLLSSIRRRM